MNRCLREFLFEDYLNQQDLVCSPMDAQSITIQYVIWCAMQMRWPNQTTGLETLIHLITISTWLIAVDYIVSRKYVFLSILSYCDAEMAKAGATPSAIFRPLSVTFIKGASFAGSILKTTILLFKSRLFSLNTAQCICTLAKTTSL